MLAKDRNGGGGRESEGERAVGTRADPCGGGTVQCLDYGGIHRDHTCDKTMRRK